MKGNPTVTEMTCRVCGRQVVAIETEVSRLPFGSSFRRPAVLTRAVHKSDAGGAKAVPVKQRRMFTLRSVLEDSCQARREQAA